ncbi:MAG: Rpn family recombination-promoting nuclease/putative transposase [Chlamydiota bacterium]
MGNINPRVDLAFKKIFGIEENKDLLISLINSIVSSEDQVVDITLLNPYSQKNFKQDKLSILDIKAEGECGKQFNIEIQITDEADYDKRALYYWAKLYAEQLKTGDDYGKLEKVIGIHILNFTSIPEAEKYHNSFHITEKETRLRYFKCLELHTIELKKFTEKVKKELGELATQIRSSLDMWSAFLTRHDLLNVNNLPKNLDKPELKKALKVLDVMNFTEEEREAYESHLKWLRIESSTLKKAEEKGREKGREEGLKEGEKKGREEGRKEGEQKGREEGEKNKAVEIAKELLGIGMSLARVAKLTRLAIEDIKVLDGAKTKKS